MGLRAWQTKLHGRITRKREWPNDSKQRNGKEIRACAAKAAINVARSQQRPTILSAKAVKIRRTLERKLF
jgi:hypothetical protein